MTTTPLDEIQAFIERADHLAALSDTLAATNRPPFIWNLVYTGATYYLLQLSNELERIARQLAINEIQQVVGNDFNANALDDEAVFDRVALLPTIADLETNYGVILVGPAGETLAEWLSNAAADLTLVASISQAVESAAQALHGQTALWDSGYLAGGLTVSPYLQSLKSATSARLRFGWWRLMARRWPCD